MQQTLVQKYNVPGPRYTSYPTVPYWEENLFTVSDWKSSFKKSFDESNTEEGISLYIHLPFCESLCTFCGCNKRITKRHEVEHPYIDAVLKEWKLYCDLLTEKPIIKEIHLGGGTPTFFSPKNLESLINGIFEKAVNMDVTSDDFESKIATLDKEKPVMVYCKSGGRSAKAASILKENGFKQVYDLDGGMIGWNDANKPVEY